MAVDLRNARIPFSRAVQVTKPRSPDEAVDSVIATVRGEDLLTPDDFTGAGAISNFQAFALTTGLDSPADRERGALYVVQVPDIDGVYVLLGNFGPVGMPLKRMFVVARHIGQTSASLFIGSEIFIGDNVFQDIVETYAEPDTTPSELSSRVCEFDTSGLTHYFKFDLVLTGRMIVRLKASLTVDTAPNIPVTWVLYESTNAGGSWVPKERLAVDSYRSTDVPVEVDYETAEFDHTKGAWYRIGLSRTDGPAGAMVITLDNPILTASVDLRGV